MLDNVSGATIRRLERDGLLTPIRLSKSPTSQVFHLVAQVRALVEKAAAEARALIEDAGHD